MTSAKRVRICPQCQTVYGPLEVYCPLDGRDLTSVRPINIDAPDASGSSAGDGADQASDQPLYDTSEAGEVSDSESRTERAASGDTLILIPKQASARSFVVRPEQVVGRSVSADVTLTGVPGLHTVSRRHAQFTLRGSQWFVRHVASTNYNVVDGDVHDSDEDVAVHDGSEVSLGDVAFTVRIDGGQ